MSFGGRLQLLRLFSTFRYGLRDLLPATIEAGIGDAMKLNRIISLCSLAVSLAVLFLLFKRPQPVAPPLAPAAAAASAESFQQKISQLEKPSAAGQAPAEVHLNSAEISAAFAQAAGAIPTSLAPASGATGASGQSPNGQSPNAAIDPASQPDIKDYNVTFDGDVAHGQFLTKIAGKDVWVTVSGHLGSKDGYATFDPTEFKVGDISVPTSLVNDAFQKKLAEQRDRLKLPDSVGGLKVENGELVVTQK